MTVVEINGRDAKIEKYEKTKKMYNIPVTCFSKNFRSRNRDDWRYVSHC